MPPYNNFRPDIVIIELKSPFNLINGIKPACLAKEPVVPGSMCYASGWGMTKSWKFGEVKPYESGFLNLQAVGLKGQTFVLLSSSQIVNPQSKLRQ